MSGMRVGVVFPQTEIGADRGGVRAYAEAAEQLGYTHLAVYDHVLGADPDGHPGFSGPYTHRTMFHEVLVLLGFLAGVTREPELVTSVVIAPQRQTALLAKQAAEVDVLSGGRLRLGLGLGWNEVEYEALGVPFRRRGRRFEEQIELMRRLWREPVVTFKGEFHRVTAAGLNPLPPEGRSIPIWIGAQSEPAIHRATRLADGLMAQRPLDGDWARTLELIRGWLSEEGRDPSTFGLEGRVNAGGGTPDEWRADAVAWRDRGATHLSINSMGGGLAGPDAHIARIREARQVVSDLT
jgi:probable F420-dependent oxidoreductase